MSSSTWQDQDEKPCEIPTISGVGQLEGTRQHLEDIASGMREPLSAGTPSYRVVGEHRE
jgi:hypothetical protein